MLAPTILLFASLLLARDDSPAVPLDVRAFGAVGDGQTDDTAAFQKALDAAAARGGGTVTIGRGSFRFAGRLNVPRSVTLQGEFTSVPSHPGIRDRGEPRPGDDGTTLLITADAGQEDAPPFLTLHGNATLKGVVLYYPDQKPDDVPTPYPFAIAMRGNNPAVLSVELLNPYKGIDASENQRALIRDVSGQPLRIGIYVDHIFDIGRIENVHFNPWWSMHRKLFQWQMQNGEAFVFGRTDWHYVFNTFAFGYHVGYHFIETKTGVANGNFLGIGADDCHTSFQVDNAARMGLLVTNGEFVAFHGDDPTMVAVGPDHTGAVRFVNCAFWGPCNQIARVAGRGTVGFSDCTFMQWDGRKQGRPAIDALGGSLIVRGCEFQERKLPIRLGENVRRAIVTGNLFGDGTAVDNQSKGAVQLDGNLPDSTEIRTEPPTPQ
jgi:hypothetical protein